MPQPPIKRPAPPPQEHDWQPGQRGSIAFGRLRMDIEPGTFGESVRLHVSVPDALPPVPEHLTLAHVFQIEARSVGGRSIRQLARPIRFTLDFADMEPREWGRGFVSLYYFDDQTRRWTVVPAQTDMRARRITALVGHFTGFGIGADSNYLPAIPPSLEGYQVDLCGGYASASVSLTVPPGTAGLTPELVLRYNSGIIDTMNGQWIRDGNNTGNENHHTRLQSSPVGLGWSLELGAVFRSHTFDAAGHEVFYLILNGTTYQLVYIDGITYRSSPDEFLRIRTLTGGGGESPNGSYWVIQTKDGTEYRFGYTTNSEQIDASGNGGGIGNRFAWQWNLDRIKDTHGNIIEISYLVQSAQTAGGVQTVETYDQAAYPAYITYTGRAGNPDTSGNRQIHLVYGDREDWVEGYISTPMPQFRSQSGMTGIATGGSSYRSYDVPKPVGATTGDILVAVSWSTTDRVPQYPTGWTLVQDLHQVSAGSLQVWWRQVTEDEPDSYTFWSCPWSNTRTEIYCWYNVDPNDPIEASAITDLHPDWGYARVLGTTTTTNNGMWLAFLIGAPNPLGDYFPDSTWTVGTPWNGDQHSRYMYKGLAVAGTIPDYDMSLGSTNNPTIQASVFLKGGGVPTRPYTQYYQKKKLTGVEMSAGGAPVRAYDLSYDYKVPYWHYTDLYDNTLVVQTEGLPKLVLTEITEKDAGGATLPATTFTYYEGLISGSEYYKLQLHEIRNSYGGKVTYEYVGHTPDGWCPLRKRYRVTQKSVESGLGSAGGESSTIVHNYGYGTSYNKADSYDYRGHAEVTVTDTAGHYEKSYFYTRDAVQETGKTDATEIERLQQRRYKLERCTSGGTVSLLERTDWSVSTTQGDAYFVRMDATRQYQGTASRKVRYEYGSYGNVLWIKEYTPASANDASWWCNTRRWYTTTDANHYIVGKLAREAIFKPGTGDPIEGDWVRDTHYCYDGSYKWDHPIGDGLYGDDQSYRGRLTAVRRVLDATSCADVTYGQDAYGNRTSATEYNSYGTKEGTLASSGPRTTTITYDPTHHTFPYQITNPLGHLETRLYDEKWGKPSQITDPNLGVTNYEYDTFGRLLSIQGPEVTGPNGSPYRRTTQYSYGLPTLVNGRTTTQLVIQTRTDLGAQPPISPSWLTTRRFYDGIGRVIQEYSDGYSNMNVVNSYYDGRGLKWKDSVPHAVAGAGAFLDGDWSDCAGAATSYTYDELGRPLVTTLPDGTTTQISYTDWSSKVWDQNQHAKKYDRDLRGRVVTITEFSGQDQNLSSYATTQYEYDLLDQLKKVTDHAGNHTIIDYDALGRKVSMTDPDMGNWFYVYDPIGTLQYQRDAKERYVYFYYDALKRLVRKWHDPFWTQSTITAGSSKPTVHDLMELRAAVDVDRKATADPLLGPFSWTDSSITAGMVIPVRAVHFTELRAAIQGLWTAAGLGSVPEFTGGSIVAGTRTIKATDLTDLRTWLGTYESSAFGQLHRARAYMEYDAYDGTTQFGKGRRTALWDGCGRQNVWWDKAGRMRKEERTVDGTLYTTEWSYDALDRVYQMTHPDNEVLTHGYAANGLLSQINSSLGVSLVSGTEYNALNLPTRYTLGSGPTAHVSQSYYGPDVVGFPYGALKTIQLQPSGSALVSRDMSYDAVGNVTSINDLVNSEAISYQYDELDRLTSASSPVNESFTYDEIGNITHKNGIPFSYDPLHKPVHAVTAYNGTGYDYDANGAMTTRGTQAISYDPESRPVKMDSGGATICRFAYDGDGTRRKRLDTQGTIHYVGPHERNVGNGTSTTEVVTKYYYGTFGQMRRLIAVRKAGVLYWIGTDHLGSTIRTANASFTPVDQMRYSAYGGSRDPGADLQTDHKFTSQIEDQSIGLYWYNSRAYDPAIGRFVVPDSIVPGAMNPQSLNRYSYCVTTR